MEEKDIVALNLISYRKKAGLSQLELAKKLQYSNKNISKWENGETTPNIFTLKKIAQLYGITVDDLLCEPSHEADERQAAKLKLTQKRKKIFDYAMLLLANAILFAVASVVIYVLGVAQVQSFNKWLMYLYITPLCMLSAFIFIRVMYKQIDIISLSLMGWLICTSVYVSFINVESIELIFVVGAAYQFIIIWVAVLVNLKLFTKFAKSIRLRRASKKGKDVN